MAPTLLGGEVVRVLDYRFGALKPGDIIAFTRHDQVFVHRVRHVFSRYVLTAGDNNPLLDEPITEEKFLGLIKGVEAGDWHIGTRPDLRSAPTLLLPEYEYRKVKGRGNIHPVAVEPLSEHLGRIHKSNAVGISLFGLDDESCLHQRVSSRSLEYLVCFAPFAVSKEGYVPIDRVSHIVRLDAFDQLGFGPIDPQDLSYLVGYLGGLLSRRAGFDHDV